MVRCLAGNTCQTTDYLCFHHLDLSNLPLPISVWFVQQYLRHEKSVHAYRIHVNSLCLVNENWLSFSGYTIPKGWKVLVWFRSVHLDPETYENPREFNPSRWDVSRAPFSFFKSMFRSTADLTKMLISAFCFASICLISVQVCVND